jgi:hypothetical protein
MPLNLEAAHLIVVHHACIETFLKGVMQSKRCSMIREVHLQLAMWSAGWCLLHQYGVEVHLS